MFTQADFDGMRRALDLAEQGLWTTTPNPRVGCVIVRDHEVVGVGWHRRAGEPHAEALALAQAGERAKGATVYVTLEPCSHVGRTPPCADALVRAGVSRVVAAMEDPNPAVNGRGLERLRAAGIDVRCGLLERDARELNLGFIQRMSLGLPWVRLKVAGSLDGFSALDSGESQWITGPSARADGHAWRARACAVLTGIGTVRDDDPQLTVREVDTPRQPTRVLIDSRLEVDLDAKILRGGAWVVCAVENPVKEQELRDRGCDIIHLPNAHGKVDLPAMLRALAQRGINELHVEAGNKLNGSFVREGCVDELLVYMAPKLLGRGQGLFALEAVPQLDQAQPWSLQDVERFGDDLRLRLRRPGLEPKLSEPASAV